MSDVEDHGSELDEFDDDHRRLVQAGSRLKFHDGFS